VGPFVLELLNVLIAGVLLVVAAQGRPTRRTALLAVLPALSACLLAIYVFGEDSYRDDGTSRWDAYTSGGGAAGEMFVLSIALMGACAVLLAASALLGRRRLLQASAVVGGLGALVLVNATIFAFSAN
jgi:hypothetical protein